MIEYGAHLIVSVLSEKSDQCLESNVWLDNNEVSIIKKQLIHRWNLRNRRVSRAIHG